MCAFTSMYPGTSLVERDTISVDSLQLCGSQRSNSGLVTLNYLIALTLLFKIGFLTSLELSKQARLLNPPRDPTWDCKQMPPCPLSGFLFFVFVLRFVSWWLKTKTKIKTWILKINSFLMFTLPTDKPQPPIYIIKSSKDTDCKCQIAQNDHSK